MGFPNVNWIALTQDNNIHTSLLLQINQMTDRTIGMNNNSTFNLLIHLLFVAKDVTFKDFF